LNDKSKITSNTSLTDMIGPWATSVP